MAAITHTPSPAAVLLLLLQGCQPIRCKFRHVKLQGKFKAVSNFVAGLGMEVKFKALEVDAECVRQLFYACPLHRVHTLPKLLTEVCIVTLKQLPLQR
jgi:hypothetical protein